MLIGFLCKTSILLIPKVLKNLIINNNLLKSLKGIVLLSAVKIVNYSALLCVCQVTLVVSDSL